MFQKIVKDVNANKVAGINILPGKHKYPDISMINFHIRTERLNPFRAIEKSEVKWEKLCTSK